MMKFSWTIGLAVLGVSSLTALGCAAMDPAESDELLCYEDADGNVDCSTNDLEQSTSSESEYELPYNLYGPIYYDLGDALLAEDDQPMGSISATPFFPTEEEEDELEGFCPPVTLSVNGDELCLVDVEIIELLDDRFGFRCLYHMDAC